MSLPIAATLTREMVSALTDSDLHALYQTLFTTDANETLRQQIVCESDAREVDPTLSPEYLPGRTLFVQSRAAVANLPDVEKIVATLNKKAARFGTAPLWVGIIAGTQRTVTVRRALPLPEGFNPVTDGPAPERKITFNAVDLIVSGPMPVLNGWRLAATLQHADEAGTIVRTVPGLDLDLSAYRTAPSTNCDHCGYSRTRKDTYIVLHEDGRTAQVGSTCLADYTGYATVESAIRAVALLAALRKVLDHDTTMRDGRDIPADEYLAYVAESIRRDGWLSKGAAYQNGGYATAQAALDHMNPTDGMRKAGTDWEPSPEAREDAAAQSEAAMADLEAHEEAGDLNDYQHNLLVVLRNSHYDTRMLGIAASALPYGARVRSDEIKRRLRAEQAVSSHHLGTVGGKVSTVATVTDGKWVETRFGSTFLVKFVTEDGAVLSWFASNPDRMLETTGIKVNLSGTVKAHNEFRGVPETMLTRCKVSAA